MSRRNGNFADGCVVLQQGSRQRRKDLCEARLSMDTGEHQRFRSSSLLFAFVLMGVNGARPLISTFAAGEAGSAAGPGMCGAYMWWGTVNQRGRSACARVRSRENARGMCPVHPATAGRARLNRRVSRPAPFVFLFL